MTETERVFLYDDTVILDFHPRSHRYYLVHNDWKEPVPSVTTICSVIDKPALIPWAVNQALDVVSGAITGGDVPSQLFLDEVWERARKAHKDVKEEAASIGREVHRILDSGDFQDDYDDSRVASGVYAGRAWLESHNVKTLLSERMVYSKRHKCVGRLDRIIEVEGKLCLADWKTSSGVWPEMVFQVAAYKAMFEEETGERLEKVYLVHLDKESGAFTPYEFSRRFMDRSFKRGFLPALKIYNQLKEVKRRIKK